MITLFANDFNTELGIVQCKIETDNLNEIMFQDNYCVNTIAHRISMKTFILSNDWLPKGMQFEHSKGWRWFIEKVNTKNEILTIFCKLIDSKIDTTWGADSGQHLDAIEIVNNKKQMHIGTEDEEMFYIRAMEEDNMPKRFFGETRPLGNTLHITEIIDFGFKTNVPYLEENEKIYFHYLAATNTIKIDRQDASTWYAVDQTKKFLDQQLLDNN